MGQQKLYLFYGGTIHLCPAVCQSVRMSYLSRLTTQLVSFCHCFIISLILIFFTSMYALLCLLPEVFWCVCVCVNYVFLLLFFVVFLHLLFMFWFLILFPLDFSPVEREKKKKEGVGGKRKRKKDIYKSFA